jgi:hypothetical protein
MEEYDSEIINVLLTIPSTDVFNELERMYSSTNDNVKMNIIMGYYTLSVVGELDVNTTKSFVEYFVQDHQIRNKLFDEWMKYLELQKNDEQISFIVDKIMTTFIQMMNNSSYSQLEKRHLLNNFNRNIWSQYLFKRCIVKPKIFDSGEEYENHGIFKTFSLIKKEVDTLDINTYIRSIIELMNDSDLSDFLVDYLWKNIDVNKWYQQENSSVRNEHHCSSYNYNLLIMNILIEIYKGNVNVYSDPTTVQSFLKGHVKNFDIKQCRNIYEKVYITLMYSFKITYIPLLLDLITLINNKRNQVAIEREMTAMLSAIFGGQDVRLESGDNERECSEMNRKISCIDIECLCDVISKYDLYYECFSTDDIASSVMTFMYEYQSINKHYVFNKGILGIISNMIGKKYGINIHVQYHAVSFLIDNKNKYKMEMFGSDILKNMMTFIMTCDVKKNISHPISRVKFIDLLFPCIMDVFSKPNSEATEMEYILVVRKLIEWGFEMLSTMDEIILFLNESEHRIAPDIIYFSLERILYMCEQVFLLIGMFYDKKMITISDVPICNDIGSLIFKMTKTYKDENVSKHIKKNVFDDLIMMALQFMLTFGTKELFESLKYSKDTVLNCYRDIVPSDVIRLLEQQFVNVSKDDIQYPEKFLDPLMSTPIQDPVVIPNSKEIFDRSTIEKIITSDHTNPYTREPLTREIFDDFNKQDESKKKIQQFTDELKEFVRSYRKER